MAFVVAITAVLGASAQAQADRHTPVPTKAQVDRAQSIVKQRAGDVASLQAALAVANNEVEAAAEKAEVAAEAYNGAVFRLQQAKADTAKAKADAEAAAQHVEEERRGLAALVVRSYQDGPSVTGMSAFIGADDVDTVMNRVGAVQSAADSMQARYDQFSAMNALARVARVKAEKAQKAQTRLTAKAAKLRATAAQAANDSQAKALQIDAQRRDLVRKLAAAQKISVKLAVSRQQHLEQVARVKAAAAARAAAAKARHDAEEAVRDSDQSGEHPDAVRAEGGWELPGLAAPNGTAAGGLKAVQYAKWQIGEPYLWAAAGPDRWDCSGLTMMSWKYAGVSLPHYSAAQYQLTKHIGVGNLRPGDLVFWGTSPNTIHHVAMYIGDGQIIQAPHTGAFVRINGMYDSEPPDFFGRP